MTRKNDLHEQWDTAAELAEAIRNEELSVEFQPRVTLSNGKVTGFEALARWKHPERGSISPAVFIPVAEEQGQILPLGRLVLREACRYLAMWNEGLPDESRFYVSVNTSLHQIEAPDFAGDVLAVLEESCIEPHLLVLEVTESCPPGSIAAARTLYDLRRAGVMVEIDDFGKGYASLTSLKMLPASALKIDGDFVGGVMQDEKDFQIVRSVIDLAHNLDMSATAEFVESGEQFLRLRALGCDFGQGYFFGRPVGGDDIPAFLGTHLADSLMERARKHHGDYPDRNGTGVLPSA